MATMFFVFTLLLQRVTGLGLPNGAAVTPPMGFNPFNVFQCNTTESDYHAAAEALVNLGLKDLGYRYLNMDCGWQSNERSTSGQFMWNTSRIPSGMAALGDYVHGLGLLFGIYSDAGYYSCDMAGGWEHWLGSRGHEQDDANTFTAWGMDYLKFSNCFVESDSRFIDYDPSSIDEQSIFAPMRDALNATGRAVVYAIDEWGIQDPATWNSSIANSWTIANTIGPSFADLQRIINQLAAITEFAGPDGWNNLDLLEVGNEGMTEAEWKTQFIFWAAAKSPLLISTDLTKISKQALDILMNKRLVSVNQDPLGQSIAFKRRYTDKYDVWAGSLEDESIVAVILNWQNTTQNITFDFLDVSLLGTEITDLWTGESLGYINGSYTATVEAHGTEVYRLANAMAADSYIYNTYYANASSNVLAGGAELRELSSGDSVVYNIGKGGTLTYVNIDCGIFGGTKLTRITYINGDYTPKNTDCSNCRRVQVSVNGKEPIWAEMPISGTTWDTLFEGYLLSLDGFVPGTENNITFSNPNAWAPDMYSIDVEKY